MRQFNRFFLACAVLAITACSGTTGGDGSSSGDDPSSGADGGTLEVGVGGDDAGTADGAENDAANTDDTGAGEDASAGHDNGATEGDQGQTGPVILVGITFHLEGWGWDEPEIYDQYLLKLDDLVEVFDTHGGVATFEAHNDFVSQVARRGDTVLADIDAAEHQVAVHADLGGNPARRYTDDQFIADLIRARDDLVDAGVPSTHVSGICSHLDWVDNAIAAGFTGVTGIVAYCTASLDAELIPEEYADCAGAGACHQNYPSDLPDRIEPLPAESSNNWIIPDPDGEIVVLPGAGQLTCMHENHAEPGVSHTQCTPEQNDIDTFRTDFEAALASADPNKVPVYYVVWSFGQRPDPQLMGDWIDAVNEYVDQGQAEWATVQQMIDRFESQ